MDVREFLEKEAGLKVLRETRNGELMMYCPLHDDNNASLAVNYRTGKYHCFGGCVKGSNGMDGFLKAIKPDQDLFTRYVAMFPMALRYEEPEPKKDEIEVEALPLAIDNGYLASRGISNETVKEFQIKYHRPFDAIVVPLYMKKELKGYVRRNIKTNPKYLNSVNLDRDGLLFPFDLVEPTSDGIIVVEGVFDVLNAYSKGVRNVVATLGGAISPGQIKLLGRLNRNLILCPDRDSSGVRIADRNTKILMKYGFHISYTFAPDGHKDFGDVKTFRNMRTHSFFKMAALRQNLESLSGV